MSSTVDSTRPFPALRQAGPRTTPTAPGQTADRVVLGQTPPALPSRPAFPSAPAQHVYPGYDRSYLDTSVRPQDDFYRYAMGGYLKSHPIPADRTSFGIRSELQDRVQNTMHDIVTEAAAAPGAAGSVSQKIGDFYASGMDEAGIEAAGLGPLQAEFDRIQSCRTAEDVQAALAHFHRNGLGLGFSFGASQDLLQPENVIGEAGQGGLGLPGPEYYTKQDEKSQKLRAAYLDHVTRMFELLGDDKTSARRNAESVMSIETDLAKASKTPAEMRDPKALYNPMDRQQLRELTPHFSWDRFFAGIAKSDLKSINVATPGFFKALDEQMAKRPVSDWQAYMRWSLIDRTASYLPKAFRDESFDFNGRTLSGAQQQQPRWKSVVGLTDAYLGEALGQKYVERAFPPEAKQKALDMVSNIRAELRDRIAKGWMSPETKKEALAKIDRLTVKIGYPDKWTDYSALHIDRGPFIGNIMRAKAFAAQHSLDSIGKPVDRGHWEMTPATVNAYYHPQLNEIVFPAARLQPPFFDPQADDASNYGATGATIAHELTHGFDDQGAQFDAAGRLRDWWTAEDKATFGKMAEGIEKQFDEFEYDGQKCQGKLVEGEAMADQGGVELAYGALNRALSVRAPQPTRDGFTPQQRFFLSYAICRESDERPQRAHLIMSTDPHPLGQFRVNGPLSNMPAFHQAFNCKPGDPMVRAADKRNKLWD
jgi:predicted metalloendopeptidase